MRDRGMLLSSVCLVLLALLGASPAVQARPRAKSRAHRKAAVPAAGQAAPPGQTSAAAPDAGSAAPPPDAPGPAAADPIAAPGEVDPAPQLRIEIGQHTAAIRQIAASVDGRILVTGSDDKTVRIWDLGSETLQRTLRPPLGAGPEGKILAVAIAPDGRTIAAGGVTGLSWGGRTASVYLFDRHSGEMRGRIRGLPSAVTRLAFSPAGDRLVAVLDEGGARVFRMPGGEPVGQADCREGSDGVDFDGTGRLVVSCREGWLRIYDPALQLKAQVEVDGKLPGSVRFAPDGTKIALGYAEEARVDVYGSDRLALLYRPRVDGAARGLEAVAWSRDGKLLYAGGAFARGGRHVIRAWPDAGQGAPRDVAGPTQRIRDLSALPTGVAFGADDPAWGLAQAEGGPARVHGGGLADFRDIGDALQIDPRGLLVRFAYEAGRSAAVFSLADLTLHGDTPADAKPVAPRPRPPGKLRRGESVLSGDTGRDDAYVLGTQTRLRSFDRQGAVRWSVDVPAAVWGVRLSQDGRLAVAALGDGTLRWYRATDGQELLAVCPHPDRRRWVAWTPTGYYDTSVGGEDMLGWHLNQGEEQAARFAPSGSRYRRLYYRPAAVGKTVETLRVEAAPAVAQAQPELRLVGPVAQTGRGPAVYRTDQRDFEIRVAVRAPPGEELEEVVARVNGRPVGRKDRDALPAGAAEHRLRVSVPADDSLIVVQARTQNTESDPVNLYVTWTGPRGAETQPKLYMLAVGVSQYRKGTLSLKYADKDARDLVQVFKEQEGRLYREVEQRVLVNGQATRQAVLDGLEWLERSTTSRDVAVLFLAGHGNNDPRDSSYYYLPYDADPERLRATMLYGDDLRKSLRNIAGKVVLFLDTCHSGNVMGEVVARGELDGSGFVNELSSAENGVVVFTAATRRQSSLEGKDWGNGVFTKAVVEGLRGKADQQRTGRVTMNMLDLYVSERVKELTGGRQAPATAKPVARDDFPLVAVGSLRRPGQRAVPLYKKWWLWTAVGVAAAGIATGAALGTTLSGGSQGGLGTFTLEKDYGPFKVTP